MKGRGDKSGAGVENMTDEGYWHDIEPCPHGHKQWHGANFILCGQCIDEQQKPKTAREVFIEAVEDGLNETPNARHPVQFSQVQLTGAIVMRCSLCKSLVLVTDQDDHRDWHDKHVAEHDRIMQQAIRYVEPPTYG